MRHRIRPCIAIQVRYRCKVSVVRSGGGFRGEMTPSKFIQLRGELKKVIDDKEDFVCIIKLMNDNVFGEEIIGNASSENGENLII